MNPVAPASPQNVDQAITEVSKRWMKAFDCFYDATQPQWKRVQNALLCFQGLPLDHIPPRLQRRIDSTFVRINAIHAPYKLDGWAGYENISAKDLTKIENLIRNLV